MFLTDYVLWVDGHDKDFARLWQDMECFGIQAQSEEEKQIVSTFSNFDKDIFRNKAKKQTIVDRSDLGRGDDKEAADRELLLRQGFGVLALINQSDNSTLNV